MSSMLRILPLDAGVISRICVVFIQTMWTTLCWAQSPSFRICQLPKKMETLEFNKILQDRAGYLWLGTAKGLFRFDGNTYKSFEGLLPDENVTALALDSLGRVWAGFRNGSVCFLDKNEVVLFQPAEGLPTMQISDMLFDKRGILWLSTHGDGIYYYVNNRLYRLDDMDGMPDLYAYDLEVDALGNIWAGTDGGAAICAWEENEVTITVVNYSNDLPDNIVKKITTGQGSKMLLATEDAGIFYFDPKTNSSTPILKGPWSFGSISDFLLVHHWVWLATDQGLSIIDIADKNATIKKQMEGRVVALAPDAEGGVWIGSKTSLIRSNGDQLQFLEPPDDKDVIALTIRDEGEIWFSTPRGLFRQEKISGKPRITNPLKNTKWSDKKVISLYTDSDNYVWAGFFGDGAIRINSETGAIQDFSSRILNGNVVNISGKNKSVWLATLGGATQIKLNHDFEVTNYEQSDGLSTDYLYQVFTDSHNRIWFATDRDGIDMLDEKGFHHFKKNVDFKVVCGFAEDSLHQVWANIQNEGLYLFDGKDFNSFEGRARLHHANFAGLTSGAQNLLIVSHQSGLDIFDSKKNRFNYVFIEGSGITKTPNLNAIAKDQRGNVFVGTNNGIIIYSHFDDQKQRAALPLIELLEVNGRPTELKAPGHLKFNQNIIKVGFTGFWYQNPAGLVFSYRLDGYDNDWLTTEGRSVNYSKLPPGEYNFRLKASDTNDFTSATETSIHFIIDPPFWNTLWFYLTIASCLVISILLTFDYRERKLRNSNRELEAKVIIRTYEIQTKSNEIKQQAEEIRRINENLESIVKARTAELEIKNKSLEDYAFLNAHKLRAPVARVLGLINLMTRIEFNEHDRIYLEHLQRTSIELDEVVRCMTQTLGQNYFERDSSFTIKNA